MVVIGAGNQLSRWPEKDASKKDARQTYENDTRTKTVLYIFNKIVENPKW